MTRCVLRLPIIVAVALLAAGATPQLAAAQPRSRAGAAARDVTAPRDAVRRHRLARESEIVRELVALLAVPNLATDSAGIRRNAALLRTMLERRGATTRLLESPAGGPPAVYGELRAPGATRTLVFYAHYDGQPVIPAQWATPPWTPTLRSGTLEGRGRVLTLPRPGATLPPETRLYARSASDDKGPIVAMLAALDGLAAAGVARSVNLKFFLEGEEEAGSDHLRALLERHAALLRADAWIFADGPRHQSGAMQVVYGVRGVLGAQLTVYGPARALHSGHYGNWAPNPAAMLASLLASMRAEDGTPTVAGFADAVRAPTAAERAAIAAIPDTDAELATSLGLGRVEGGGARLLERIMLPALNVSGLQAGGVGAQASNTINSTATAALDFRLVPDQTPAGVRRAVEAHVRARGYHVVHDEPDAATLRAHPRVARLEWGEGYAGIRTDLGLPVARAVAQLAEEALGTPVLRVPTLGGSLPLTHFAEVLRVPLVIVPIVNADNNQHAANENLRLQNLWEGMEVFGQLVGRLGAVWR